MDKGSNHSDEDTIAPMPQRKVPAAAAGGPAAGPGGRRGTLMMGAGGPRKSIAAGMLGRMSLSFAGARRSKMQEEKYENTYRTEPKADEKISVARIRAATQEGLEDSIGNYRYSSATSGMKVKEVAQSVRDRVKDVGFDRYKFVVNVLLFSKDDDVSVTVGSRAIWSVDCGDTCIEAKHSNSSVTAIITVHCFYYE